MEISAPRSLTVCLLSCLLPQVAFGLAWPDGPTKTITYTNGTSIGVVYLPTDSTYTDNDLVTVVSGSAPPGISWAGFGTCTSDKLCTAYYGTPSGASGTYTQVLRAQAGAQTADLTVVFQPAFTVTGTLTSTGIVGSAYSSGLGVIGGTAPVTWSISAGSLPSGLTLNSSTGTVSGTPAAAGTFSFTVRATDSQSLAATSAQSITVYGALSVTTSSLPQTTVGASYSQTLASSGGTTPKTWSVSSGSLPAGLSLNGSTGGIAGTATAAGTSSFSVQVACCSGATASASLGITVNAAPSVTTGSLPDGGPGAAYSQTLSSSGGTGSIAWAVTSGSLPTGLSLDSSTGVISGTPATSGTSAFTVTATDSLSISGSASLSIQIVSLPSITTSSLAPVTEGQSVSTSLAATSGTTPYTWLIDSGSLPAGISLNSSTGALTGAPSVAGTAAFTVRVTDAGSGTATQALTWTVNAAPSISTSSLSDTTVGAAYSQTLAGSGGTGSLTWGVSAGSLPAGLALNASTGAITGTPVAAGTASFTASLTDSQAVAATRALSIAVNAAPSVTTASLPEAVLTQAYAQTLAATGGTGALTWAVTAGSLPAGLSLNAATGVLSGTPTTAGAASFTVTAMDSLNVSGSQALAISVAGFPSITTSSLPAITVSQNVAATVAATAGTAPYAWSVSAGSLPAGVSINSSTGALTGSPTAGGAASFTVRVTDAHSLEATQALTWIVNAAPSVTTASLPATTVGAVYSQSVVGTGGTGSLTWSVSAGSLPAGLSLDASTGAITGTATTATTAEFTVSYTDANSIAGTKALSIAVNAAPAITTTALPRGVKTEAYSQTLAATGGTGARTWSVAAGGLPAGLALDGSTGVLSGTPTAAGAASFTVQVADSLTIAGTQALTLTVYERPDITTTTLAPVTVGQSVSVTAAAAAGTPPFQWSVSVGALPAGLALHASTGAITGAPTAAGEVSFTLRVTDSQELEDTQAIAWTVNGAASVTTTSLPATTVGASYARTLAATGGTAPLTWAVTHGSLPAGLSLNTSTGAISGTSTTAGTAAITVTATDANSTTAAKELSILVNPAPAIATESLPFGVTTLAYSQTLAATGGTAPLEWSVSAGALPAGLALNTSTGSVTGTPEATGTANFTLRIADAAGIAATRAYTLAVVDHPRITTPGIPPAIEGQAYTVTLEAAAGTPPYAWSISAGALPPGLTLDPAGRLAGTPETRGTYSLTLKVTDAKNLEATRVYTWRVTPPAIRILTTSLAPAYVNTNYTMPLGVEGGAGSPVWAIASGALPAGLALSPGGVIEGMADAAHSEAFVARVTDADGNSATQELTLEVRERPGLRVSPEQLTFTVEEGSAPAPQQVEIVSTPAGIEVTAAADRPWLRLSFDRAGTPAVLSVSTAAGLEPGDYTGVITVAAERTRTVAVALHVTPKTEPKLDVSPSGVTISRGRDTTLERRLLSVRVTGMDTVGSFSASATAPWLALSPASPSSNGREATFVLTADLDAAGSGAREAIVTFRAGSLERGIAVAVTAAPVSFDLSQSGLTFNALVNGTGASPQEIRVANRTATPLVWTASADQAWVRLEPPSGTANPDATLGIRVDTAGLAAGAHAARLSVAPQAPGSAAGEARPVEVRLNLAAGGVGSHATPLGLTFQASSVIAAQEQTVSLSNPHGAATTFAAMISPPEAAQWLSLGAVSGSIAAGQSASLAVQARRGSLAPGVYHGALTIEFGDQTVQVVRVVFTVAGASCTPAAVVPVFTQLGDHFAVRAGWPAPVEVLVRDNCGAPVTQGSGLLQFSDRGEPALPLVPGPGGRWTATWTPVKAHTSITASATVANPDHTKGTVPVTGEVSEH